MKSYILLEIFQYNDARSKVAFSTFHPEYNFLVNAPFSAIIFPAQIPLLVSLKEVNTVRKNSKSLKAKEANLILTVVREIANS